VLGGREEIEIIYAPQKLLTSTILGVFRQKRSGFLSGCLTVDSGAVGNSWLCVSTASVRRFCRRRRIPRYGSNTSQCCARTKQTRSDETESSPSFVQPNLLSPVVVNAFSLLSIVIRRN